MGHNILVSRYQNCYNEVTSAQIKDMFVTAWGKYKRWGLNPGMDDRDRTGLDHWLFKSHRSKEEYPTNKKARVKKIQ